VKKFEFRLAAVLRLRETQLEIEKNKLQRLFHERRKLENTISTLGQERTAAEVWLQNMESASSADLRALSAFLLGSKSREAGLQHSLQGCNEDIAEQRQRTLLAERNLKLLVNLRTRQKAGWQNEFDKELESIAQEAWQSAARSKQQM